MYKVIQNCDVAFRKRCPVRWESLSKGSEKDRRYCEICQQQVYFCTTNEQALAHAKRRDCIAMPMIDRDGESPIYLMGQPEISMPVKTKEERRLEAQASLERAKMNALRNRKYTDLTCEGCGFPLPPWHEHCWVCWKQLDDEE